MAEPSERHYRDNLRQEAEHNQTQADTGKPCVPYFLDRSLPFVFVDAVVPTLERH